MSSNYLNAELFILFPSLSSASLHGEAFFLPLSLHVSHEVSLSLFTLSCLPTFSLSPLVPVILLPFLPLPLSLCLFFCQASPPLLAQVLWAELWGPGLRLGEGSPPPPQGPYLPGLGSQGEFTFPAAPAWVRGIFPIWPPRAPILWPEAP